MTGRRALAKSGGTVPSPSEPVRVGLRRIHAGAAKPYPQNGPGKVWWAQLKDALGTDSSDFVNASLIQLMAAARLPGGSICPIAMNSA